MKFIANCELRTLNGDFKKGEFIPEEFVTSEMKELKLVTIVDDKCELLFDNSSNIEIIIDDKRELLFDNSSNIEIINN